MGPRAVGSRRVSLLKEKRNKEVFLRSVSSRNPLFLMDPQVAAVTWLNWQWKSKQEALTPLQGITKPGWISRGLDGGVEQHFDLIRNPMQFCLTQLFILWRCLSPRKPLSSPMPSPASLSLCLCSDTEDCHAEGWSLLTTLLTTPVNRARDQPATPWPLPCSNDQRGRWYWEDPVLPVRLSERLSRQQQYLVYWNREY